MSDTPSQDSNPVLFSPKKIDADSHVPHSARTFFPGNLSDSNSFTPVSQLSREDADVTLAFLSANSIPFSTPIDDPWYSAHSYPFQATINDSALGYDSGSAATGTAYFRDRPVSVLACTEQYQLCTPNSSPGCTSLTGINLLEEAVGGLGLNSAQAATAEILFASTLMTLFDVIELLGTSSLLAENSKFDSIQGFLPSNQWTLEVESWNQIVLADMQRSVLEYATGPSNQELLSFLLPPNGSSQAHICHNQRARSGQAQSFSVLAIVSIFTLGLLIICVDLGLHRLVGYVQREKDLKDYRRLAWKSNGILQLQRLAHEEAGFGSWERCTKAVPVTAEGEVLAVLDVNDSEHPVLLKSLVLPSQAIQPTSPASLNRDTPHNDSPEVTNTTDSDVTSGKFELKSEVEVHETGMSPLPTIHLSLCSDSSKVSRTPQPLLVS